MSPRLVGGGVLVLLVLSLGVYAAVTTARLWGLRQEMNTLQNDITTLRARAETLAQTVERLRTDPSYIEKLAREDLGLVREGDTVLKFPSAPK